MTASVLIAGEPSAGEVLEESLLEEGVAARFHPANGLSETFVSIESRLEENRPSAAVAVGSGEAALTIAITAAKLGIPVVRIGGVEAKANADNERILSTLAELDAGARIGRAAGVIAAWLRGEPPPPDLD